MEKEKGGWMKEVLIGIALIVGGSIITPICIWLMCQMFSLLFEGKFL